MDSAFSASHSLLSHKFNLIKYVLHYEMGRYFYSAYKTNRKLMGRDRKKSIVKNMKQFLQIWCWYDIHVQYSISNWKKKKIILLRWSGEFNTTLFNLIKFISMRFFLHHSKSKWLNRRTLHYIYWSIGGILGKYFDCLHFKFKCKKSC